MSDGSRRKWNKGFIQGRNKRFRLFKVADLFSQIAAEAIWIVHAHLIPSAKVSIGDEVFLSAQRGDGMILAQGRAPLMRLTASSSEQIRVNIGNDTTTPVVGEVMSGPDEYGIVEIRLARTNAIK